MYTRRRSGDNSRVAVHVVGAYIFTAAIQCTHLRITRNPHTAKMADLIREYPSCLRVSGFIKPYATILRQETRDDVVITGVVGRFGIQRAVQYCARPARNNITHGRVVVLTVARPVFLRAVYRSAIIPRPFPSPLPTDRPRTEIRGCRPCLR